MTAPDEPFIRFVHLANGQVYYEHWFFDGQIMYPRKYYTLRAPA